MISMISHRSRGCLTVGDNLHTGTNIAMSMREFVIQYFLILLYDSYSSHRANMSHEVVFKSNMRQIAERIYPLKYFSARVHALVPKVLCLIFER